MTCTCPHCGKPLPVIKAHGLTPKQAQLLRYLQESLLPGRACPSYDEMGRALGLKSKNGVHRLVQGLKERGYVQAIPGRPRSMTLTQRGIA